MGKYVSFYKMNYVDVGGEMWLGKFLFLFFYFRDVNNKGLWNLYVSIKEVKLGRVRV